MINFSRREQKSQKITEESEAIRILDHFCGSLHGLIGGAIPIECVHFKATETQFDIIVKIPFE